MLADLEGLDIGVPSDGCLGRWRSDRLSAERLQSAVTRCVLPLSLGGSGVNQRHLIGRICRHWVSAGVRRARAGRDHVITVMLRFDESPTHEPGRRPGPPRAGPSIVSINPAVASAAPAASKAVLSISQIASRVDPGLADVVSADGYQQATSAGTGIVLTSPGEVLTNNHVIEGATFIDVTDIGNGQKYTATAVGYDATADVAVLQLQGASALTTPTLGDSATVQAGDRVVALGNAGGKGGTPSVVSGTVTALDQSITASDELSGPANS
jgi:S1-C subfamily serine protease